MNYTLMKDVVDLLAEFEKQAPVVGKSELTVNDFKMWIASNYNGPEKKLEPMWEGKENGRSPESVINTLLVHLNRYAKSYSKSAIFDSEFSSQEEFIYLINLKAFGQMTKMDLIKKNVQEKPVGMQTINRLIHKGWVNQTSCNQDKRSKVLTISFKGLQVLENQMHSIQKASSVVTADLTYKEKMELITLLSKLNDYHRPIYDRNLPSKDLLKEVVKDREH